MSRWYIQQFNAEVGPMTGAELLQMVRQGIVTEQTMVRKDDSAWFAAIEVGGLFDTAANRLREHHCPECDSVVAPPPSVCPRCGQHLAYAPTRFVESSPNREAVTEDAAARVRRTSVQRWLQKIKTPPESG